MHENKTMVCLSNNLIRFSVLLPLCLSWLAVSVQSEDKAHHFVNSVGIKMIQIQSGSFEMGNPNPGIDGWDEEPVHRVTISRSFYISETEVTIEQYQKFRSEFKVNEAYAPFVTGIKWNDAMEFCEWLSKIEGKTYRLPTEAEWEYACRAGTGTPFWSGEELPPPGAANPWGLINLHQEPLEWCWDWYGPYSISQQVDPVGPGNGMAKVVRGGGLDKQDPVYARSFNRAAVAPAFGRMNTIKKDDDQQLESNRTEGEKTRLPGNHPIGFRVVQADMPMTNPADIQKPFVSECVIQNQPLLDQGPVIDKPWFRKRPLLPMPPDNVPRGEIRDAGLHPGMMPHNHSPGLEVCPNGDVLMVIYTSEHEYEPEVSLMASRLRFGSAEWDMPEIVFDFPDVNDHAPCLYTEKDKMYVFWGNPRLDSAYPFQWRISPDNGANWSPVQFPQFINKIGPHSRQPINTVLRAKDGTLYVSSDGEGGTSVLWATADNGATWYDTGGRSAGRHTTYTFLKDGRILGMGGKNTEIDGYMPKAISSDGGKTWEVSKTPFSQQGSNQRPCILRLQSGRLFFCADLQHISGKHPDTIPERGSFVALSEDEGETWHVKKLAGTQPHENGEVNKKGTIGYSVARQATNGVIHLIATMTTPCLHYELNEAWILSDKAGFMEYAEPELKETRNFEEKYPSGQIKASWSGGVGLNGEYLLDGKLTWYHENGQKQWEVMYSKGKKVGIETYWNPSGQVLWSWKHDSDGAGIWTQFWPDGKKRSESHWKNFMANGPARRWNHAGEMINECRFKDGRLAD